MLSFIWKRSVASCNLTSTILLDVNSCGSIADFESLGEAKFADGCLTDNDAILPALRRGVRRLIIGDASTQRNPSHSLSGSRDWPAAVWSLAPPSCAISFGVGKAVRPRSARSNARCDAEEANASEALNGCSLIGNRSGHFPDLCGNLRP